MKSIRPLCLGIAILFATVPLPAQNVNPMHPEEISAQKHQSPDEMRAHVASAQLQKEAKELSELCASVPGDMDSLKQGLMAKDLPEKLKRMEKLSKHLRDLLTQAAPAP